MPISPGTNRILDALVDSEGRHTVLGVGHRPQSSTSEIQELSPSISCSTVYRAIIALLQASAETHSHMIRERHEERARKHRQKHRAEHRKWLRVAS